MKVTLIAATGFASAAYAAVAAQAHGTVTTTATTTTSLGCLKAVATDAPGFQCKVKGTLSNPSLISSTKQPLQDCQDACLFDDKCLAFGYNKQTHICELHNKNLKVMGLTADSTSHFVYSNQHCVVCDEEPVKSSTKKSSSISSTSSSSGKKTKTKTTSSSSIQTSKTKTKTKSSSSTEILSSSSTSKTKTKASKTSTGSATATGGLGSHATCTEKVVYPSTNQNYTRYFVGAGVVESTMNPGNRNIQQPPINSTLSGSYASDCDAIAACADSANFAAYQYYSFDLHYLSSTSSWVCTQYYDPNHDPAYFNVTNTDVVVAYGFYNPNY